MMWYVLKGDASQDYHYDPREFKGIQWYGFDEIPYEKSDPHMRRFVAKLKSLITCY